MLIAILSCFIFSLVPLAFDKQLKGKLSLISSLLPIGLFLYFLSFLPTIADGKRVLYKMDWVPSMGIQLDLNLDGLSYLFVLLITGIGALVFLYSIAYMKGHVYIGRFYCYLCLFMG